MKADRVDTWAATIQDRPGALAAKLDVLRAAKVNLEFVIARREASKPGTGVVFVTPIKTAAQVKAARKAGFRKATSMHAVRVEGPDRPGQGARMTEAIAAAGINLKGLSAAAIGKKFVANIAVETTADANRVKKALAKL